MVFCGFQGMVSPGISMPKVSTMSPPNLSTMSPVYTQQQRK
ncbi:hypothetical protein AWB74_03019 [Caballeronia arvi]|uniref:Uncharacterized protein n=1 Tax=Caballeronia arvi TaxID=1777135 RepID=A0A158IW69_9BURK|nr:hypothetical protein AWB74_03019 [Caballeronia arvi]